MTSPEHINEIMYIVRSRSAKTAMRYAMLYIALGVTLLISAADRWGEKRHIFSLYNPFVPSIVLRAKDPAMSRKYPLYIIVEAFQFNRNGDDTRYQPPEFLIPCSRVDRIHLLTLSVMKKNFNFSARKDRAILNINLQDPS